MDAKTSSVLVQNECGECRNWSTAFRNNCNECLRSIKKRKFVLEQDLRVNRAINEVCIDNDGSVKYIIDPRITELVILKS